MLACWTIASIASIASVGRSGSLGVWDGGGQGFWNTDFDDLFVFCDPGAFFFLASSGIDYDIL